MNKKNILKTMALAAITTVAMTSCNQSAPKVDEKSDAAQPTPKGLKIAYVEVDSIMSQYQFCKDETQKYNNALRDSIQHYLKVYNKDKHYSLILSKAGDNLLYADKSFDITNEIIAGLNKAYKPSEKMKAAMPTKK